MLYEQASSARTSTAKSLPLRLRKNAVTVVRLGCFLGCEGEIAEVGSLSRGAFCPEDEKLASILRGVRAMCVAGLEMQRSAGLVLLALVGKVALDHIERLGHAFVEMCRDDCAGVHTDVQHYRP
jgi:hypothetical protein